MVNGVSFGWVISILPSIRQTTSRSGADLPHRSVPRMPAFTVLMLMFKSRLPRNCANSSEVKRNAPSATFSVASKTLLPRICIPPRKSELFSPSFTALPSAVLRSRREPAPVLTWSLSLSSMPGMSGWLAPPRSTQAGICTASTVASGAGCVRFDLDSDCAIAAPPAPSVSAASSATIDPCLNMIDSDRFSMRVDTNARRMRRAADPRGYNSCFSRTRSCSPSTTPRSSSAKRRSTGSGPARFARPRSRPEKAAARSSTACRCSLPFGQAAYGARAQLYHRRRDDPLPSDARLQRASTDGLGRLRSARRKRRDGERRAAGEMDLRQHRLHEEATPVARFRDRLGARARDLLAPVLSLEPVAVPAHARKGSRLQEDRNGQLGPGRPDGACERAGDRRPRLAHRGARR